MDDVKIMSDILYGRGQVSNLRKHKPEKGSCKGLRERTEREKCDAEIRSFCSLATLRKHNNDFVQMLPFYLQFILVGSSYGRV